MWFNKTHEWSLYINLEHLLNPMREVYIEGMYMVQIVNSMVFCYLN